MACALVWDGLQGANHSNSRSYREDLQRCRPPKAGMRGTQGTCSALPYTIAPALGSFGSVPPERWDLIRSSRLMPSHMASAAATNTEE